MAPDWLWVLVTLAASSAQTLRNAMQRDLIGALGALGAAEVRFLFGLPFAALFLISALIATGLGAPRISLAALGWTAFGALSQVIATASGAGPSPGARICSRCICRPPSTCV